MTRRNRYKCDINHETYLRAVCVAVICAAILLTTLQMTRHHYTVNTMPPTEEERQNALHHVLSTVSNEELCLYNYYAERSKP